MRAALFICLLVLGACACAAPGYSQSERASFGAYRLEALDAYGSPLPTFERMGRTYVLGEEGQRYRLRITNSSPRRIEAVVSVDGRDALDGKPSRFEKSGYVIGPYGSVVVDGFRLSLRDVATFRFSSVGRSYAAQMGDARAVGVIGVAIFSELRPPPPRYYPPVVPRPEPYPPEPCDEASAKAPQSHKDQSQSRAAPPAGAKPASPLAEGRAGAGAARQQPGHGDRPAEERPGLGTEFGERRSSWVQTTQFRRAHGYPDGVLTLRYNDRDGLLALGIELEPHRRPIDDELWRRERARPFGNQGFAAPPPGWR